MLVWHLGPIHTERVESIQNESASVRAGYQILFIPPPSVTGEVYYLPRRQLIFSFGPTNFEFVFELLTENRKKKHSNELRGVKIDQSSMCYISMDSARRALQSDGFFSDFVFVFELMAENL